jgi:hypothetical protein
MGIQQKRSTILPEEGKTEVLSLAPAEHELFLQRTAQPITQY